MTGCVKEGGDIRFRWSEFKPHLQKTFIGKKEHDFEFLGHFIKPGVLRVTREHLKDLLNAYL